MEVVRRRGPLPVLAGLGAVVVILFALGAIFDLGPFEDEDLSTAEFIGRGDQICKEAHDAFVEVQANPPQTSREAADLNERLASIADDEREELAELAEPPALSSLIGRYLEARERGIEALNRGADAAREEDDDTYRAEKQALEREQADRRRLAVQIGFSECSRALRGSQID